MQATPNKTLVLYFSLMCHIYPGAIHKFTNSLKYWITTCDSVGRPHSVVEAAIFMCPTRKSFQGRLLESSYKTGFKNTKTRSPTSHPPTTSEEGVATVLVHSGCYNRILCWETCKPHILIPHSSEGWGVKVMAPAIQCLERTQFLVHRCHLFTMSSHDKRGKGLFGVSFIRDLIISQMSHLLRP